MPGRLVGGKNTSVDRRGFKSHMSFRFLSSHLPLSTLITSSWLRLRRLAQDDRLCGLIMLLAAVLGLVCVNVPRAAEPYQAISTWIPFHGGLSDLVPGLDMNLKEWVQDGLLTIFFLVIGLDLRQEISTGTLHSPRQTLLPMMAALGGVIAPIGIYLAINQINPIGIRGWAVPTATDVAFSLAALRILAPQAGAELQAFLMTLAVFDDIIGVLLIALGYSHLSQAWILIPVALCLAVWHGLVQMKRIPWLLALLTALGAWYGLLLTGIHPVLSGVALGLLTPGDPIHGEDKPRAGRFSRALAPLSALLILPLFAFLSMGIPLSGFRPSWLINPVFLGITGGLALGKPLGIMIMLTICSRVGLKLPMGIRMGDLAGLAQLCGIGFTMSFLIANLAYTDPHLTDMALIAVLTGSALSILLAAMIFSIQNHKIRRSGGKNNMPVPIEDRP